MKEKEMNKMPDRYSSTSSELEREKAAHSNLGRSDSMKAYHQGMREKVSHNSGMQKGGQMGVEKKGGY